MEGPDSSYSAFEIHIVWKVLSELRMDPPIHVEYLRSGGATTLIFIYEAAMLTISLLSRSDMPSNIVLPPERMMLLYKSLRMSMSQRKMDCYMSSCRPEVSFCMSFGWNRASAHLNR